MSPNRKSGLFHALPAAAELTAGQRGNRDFI
jgi:hypothetical protein